MEENKQQEKLLIAIMGLALGGLIVFYLLAARLVERIEGCFEPIITAEEYLLHPDYYKVDTVKVNGCTFYHVKEEL